MYNFFVRVVALYKPVTLNTVARWVLETLGKPEINTKTFLAHVLCFASISATYNKGLSLL